MVGTFRECECLTLDNPESPATMSDRVIRIATECLLAGFLPFRKVQPDENIAGPCYGGEMWRKSEAWL